MGRNYFENPSCNVAFERCIDVLAELIEKYACKLRRRPDSFAEQNGRGAERADTLAL